MIGNQVLDQLRFCVLDIETTGSNPKTDRIIDIGMVHLDGLEIKSSKGIIINPQKKIPPFIQKLTGLGDEDIKDAPTIEEVIDDIAQFIGDRIIVAHNITFDLPFLNDTIKKLKRPPLTNKMLCTQIMSKYLIPGMMNSNLSYLCDLFHIKHERAHQALSDAKATTELLVHYLQFFQRRGMAKVNQLYYPKHHFEFDRLHLRRPELADFAEWTERYIKPLQGPFSLSGKGPTGELIYINAFSSGAHFLSTVSAGSLPGDIQISIKIFGTLLEAFNHAREGYLKSAKGYRNSMIESMEQAHQLSSPIIKTKKDVVEWMELLRQNHLLVFCKHLIQDQLNVFIAPNFHPKDLATFKVSTQRKKLIQFLEQTQKKQLQPAKKIDPSHIDLRLANLSKQLFDRELTQPCYLPLNQSDLEQSTKELEYRIQNFNLEKISLHDYPAQPL